MHPITAVPRTWHFLHILSVAQLSAPKKQGALINIGCDWSREGWSGRHGSRGAARNGWGYRSQLTGIGVLLTTPPPLELWH